VTGLVVPRTPVRVSSGYFYSFTRCAPRMVTGEAISSAPVNPGAAWVFINHIVWINFMPRVTCPNAAKVTTGDSGL
jgi:hypothetical protein